MKLLYIEDDPAARQLVERGMARNGIRVDLARTLAEGFARASEGQHDALILDISLPDGEGLELLARLRAAGVDTPALCLSARGAIADRLRGFERGADDYLAKPFALAELLARLRAIVRRRQGDLRELLRAGDLEMDLRDRSVHRAGERLDLPPKQFAVLELLLRNQDRVVRREQIVKHAWSQPPRANVVNVQISALRKRVDSGRSSAPLIQTVPGVGYVLRSPSQPRSRGGRGA